MMQVGMNSNIHHQAKVLHIQTEDSGFEHGHIITHIFLSGSIIASQKLEYARDSDEMTIKELIRSQHQDMIQALKTGQFDKKILLNRAHRAQGTIPLARKKSNQNPLKTTSHTITKDNNEVKPTSRESSLGHNAVEESDKVNFQSQGIWALPQFHREQHQSKRKQKQVARQSSDKKSSS